jgi:tetratricopeptide (TPR) repeat protein
MAAARPTTRLADVVSELNDRQRRLDRLDASDDPRAAVTTVFSWSYRQLPTDTARLFQLLGVHPGPDVDAYAAAALADRDLDQTRRDLAALSRAHLIHAIGTDRYGMHDLLRGYATRLAGESREAQDRLFDYYLGTVAAAMDILYPAEARQRPKVPTPATPLPVLPDPAAARAWLDAERPGLVAVARCTAIDGWPGHAVHLSATLFRHLEGGHYADGLVIHGHAAEAARRAGDRAGEATALLGLGAAYGQIGCYDEASAHLRRALRLATAAGDPVSQGRALTSLGNLERRLGRHRPAAEHHEQALALFQEAGDRIGEARTLTNLGIVYRRLGRYTSAANHSRRALTLFRRAGDRVGEAWARVCLGSVQARLGRHHPAIKHHAVALTLFRQIGDRAGAAWTLESLGAAHTDLRQPEQAAEYYRQAMSLFRQAGDRYGETWAQNGLGEAALAAGQPAEALARHRAVHPAATVTGACDQQARAHLGLGNAHRALGDSTRAHEQYRQALALYTELEMPEADDVRAHIAALTRPTRSTQRSAAGRGPLHGGIGG